jgi:hypothetical protein
LKERRENDTEDGRRQTERTIGKEERKEKLTEGSKQEKKTG